MAWSAMLFQSKAIFTEPSHVHDPGCVQSSVNLHGALEALEVPLISRIPFPVVRLVEQEIPHAVERVDLKIHVVHGIAIWVDEDLEIRIRSAYYGIPLCQRPPAIGVLHIRRHVEVVVVPQHFRPRVAR